MKKYYSLLLIFISSFQLYGQEVSFSINAPETIVKGAQINLTYILKGGNGTNLAIPEEIDGFDILFGPSVSQSSYSYSDSSGKMISGSNISFTYTLMSNAEGSFTLPEASIVVNGKTYKSGTKKIKVLPPDKNSESTAPGQQPQTTSIKSTDGKIDPEDVFIRAIFPKNKIKEQEAVTVTFRFYSVLFPEKVESIEFPEFEGFITEDQPMSSNRQLQMEHYKGRNYYVMDIRKTVLFPQRSGKITIPSGKMEIVLNVPTGRKMRTFWGVRDEALPMSQMLQSNPITLDVSPLPLEEKPADFSGGVGTFTFKADISEKETQANNAITINVEISGTGNLKLIREPVIKFPSDFEVYDPKVSNNISTTDNGQRGSKTIEYMFIPRYPGEYIIPPIEFSYYDLKTQTYKTLASESYTLKIAKDPTAGSTSSASYMNKTEVYAEQDIRHLKLSAAKHHKIDSFLIGSTSYLLWYIVPSLLFIIFFIVYRKQIKANSNVALMRTRKANKAASKRLKLAKKYLLDQKKESFYEEILRAVWGYLSDKLTIPVANLNRENIELELEKYGASTKLIRQYISILDTCEFAHYAPSSSSSAMDQLYDDTIKAIDEMEDVIKIKK